MPFLYAKKMGNHVALELVENGKKDAVSYVERERRLFMSVMGKEQYDTASGRVKHCLRFEEEKDEEGGKDNTAVDAAALSYAEVRMLATGDARIKEKMNLDIQVAKLKMLRANHQSQQYEMLQEGILFPWRYWGTYIRTAAKQGKLSLQPAGCWTAPRRRRLNLGNTGDL